MRAMEASKPGPDADLRVGSRVVVRHLLDARDPVSGATLTDVVGQLVDADGEFLVVATRRGEVRVPRARVTAAKVVPPAPARRGAPHRALSVEDLQRVMVGAWPPMHSDRLGEWVLRASRGFTQRANSVVTAGSPGLPVPEALDVVERWYAGHRLPPNLTVAGPLGSDPARDPVAEEALARGYAARAPTLTLTASASQVAARPDDDVRAPGVRVEVGEALTDGWFGAYRSYRTVDEVAARAILTGSPSQDFATALDERGAVVGIGRLGVADAWGGVAAMWVAPAVRRRGVASAVLAALAREAVSRGVMSLHLQTDSDNAGALGFYERCGFERHHQYVNLSRR